MMQLAKALGYALLGIVVALLVGFVLFVDNKPDPKVWHTAKLDEEFTERSGVETFEEYLALEQRLFAQLEERVLDRIEPEGQSQINRYHRGSLSDPGRWPRNWNHSFELRQDAPKAGVLLLHGMSDSPYSVRTLAERLHAAGAWAIGLRIPGHGTAPVGLTRVRWEDMAAAVRLAALHLHERVGDRPLFLVGYSNGGALSVQYAISALEDASLPAVDGVFLLSPEIGVTPAAAFAVWQQRIGRLLGLEKLEWNSMLPEYDPFKYQSFAVNAGEQAYRITAEIRERLAALQGDARLGGFPRVLAFQSAVDATVSTTAVIEVLMARLPRNGHELVLFDLNRTSEIESVLKHDPGPELLALLGGRQPFAIRVVTNESRQSRRVVARHKPAGESDVATRPLDLSWPRGVFSLAHVALPFPAADPLYGNGSGPESPGVRLGQLALRGERGVLQISAAEMLRQRWNPFHRYVEERLLEFTGLESQ